MHELFLRTKTKRLIRAEDGDAWKTFVTARVLNNRHQTHQGIIPYPYFCPTPKQMSPVTLRHVSGNECSSMDTPSWSDDEDMHFHMTDLGNFDDEEQATGSWVSNYVQEWVMRYPGTEGPMCLTPRMAMKLNIVAVVMASSGTDTAGIDPALFAAISEHLEKGELPPTSTPGEKHAMKHVLRVAREWDADGLFYSRYCHWDDIKFLPAMDADRDFDIADKICLYLRRIREQDQARSPLYSVENIKTILAKLHVSSL